MFEYISSRVAHMIENKPGCYPNSLEVSALFHFFTAPLQNGTSPAASWGIRKRLLPDFRLENATMRPCIVVTKQVNSYIGSHVGLYAVTNSSSHVTFAMTSCAHCHTIIHIQSYRYNHTHTSMQWCCTMVKEPRPGTSTGICTGTLQKLTRCLHRNLPEPQQVSAAETSGTLTRYLHRNLPEPHQVSQPT